MPVKIISICSALALKKLSLLQFCFTQRNQKEMRRGTGNWAYNRVFNLCASFWSVEILVLCYPDDVLVSHMQLSEASTSALGYLYFPT